MNGANLCEEFALDCPSPRYAPSGAHKAAAQREDRDACMAGVRDSEMAAACAHGDRLAQLTRAECAERLRAADIAYGFVNEVADLARHPALRRLPVATPGGVVEVAAPAVIFSDGPRAYGPVPALDEHGIAIRDEFAG